MTPLDWIVVGALAFLTLCLVLGVLPGGPCCGHNHHLELKAKNGRIVYVRETGRIDR